MNDVGKFRSAAGSPRDDRHVVSTRDQTFDQPQPNAVTSTDNDVVLLIHDVLDFLWLVFADLGSRVWRLRPPCFLTTRSASDLNRKELPVE